MTRLPPFPFQEKTDRTVALLDSAEFEPTGIDRHQYLDVAERIVRDAVRWQDEEGLIIGPVYGAEFPTTTARFIAALAPLIGAGRCADLLPAVALSLDAVTEQMTRPRDSDGAPKSPDFFTRDVMLGIRFVGPKVAPERLARWRNNLAAVHPDDFYWGHTREDPANWVVYAIVGEHLKTQASIADTGEWFEREIARQLHRFTAGGMYRDPGCPVTYDLTVRQGFSWMLFNGYDGEHRAVLDELLRRGALTMLAALSPTGEAPCGGRSNQFHIAEGMMACICEYEARRYAQANPALAGAFKRQAHLALQATLPWLQNGQQWWYIRNRFAPETRHGCESYTDLSCYALLAANLFGVAYLLADDEIAEGATPSDIGGFCWEWEPDFHRIFATCQGTHLQLDTRGQEGYDATGLGRFHRRGVPTYLGLSVPFPQDPHFPTSIAPPAHNFALGPGWRDDTGNWVYLADYQANDWELEVLEENVSRVRFALTYHLPDEHRVREQYTLTAGGVKIVASIEPACAEICLVVPVFETDGVVAADITARGDEITATVVDPDWQPDAPNRRYTFTATVEGVPLELTDQRIPNRNGIYRVAVARCGDAQITCRLRLGTQAAEQ